MDLMGSGSSIPKMIFVMEIGVTSDLYLRPVRTIVLGVSSELFCIKYKH